MRWPIHVQLLLPILSVVLLAIALASVAVAYWRVVQVRRQQEEHLARVAGALTDATFPLSDRVLRQMSGLAGAQMVLIDSSGNVEETTLELQARDLAQLHALLAADPGGAADRPTVRLGDRDYLGDRVPLVRRFPSGKAGFLVMLYPQDRLSAAVEQAVWPSLAAGAVMAAVVVLITTLLARRFVRPIQQLGRRTASIAGGDFAPLAVPRRNDEIRDLTVSINRMAEQLGRYESEVRRSERLHTLGQLGAGMAHTLRNLSTGAGMAIGLHRRECPAGAESESLEVAVRQLALMESYLKRFLTLGQSPAASRERLALGPLVEEVLDLVRPACRHAGIELEFRPAGEPVEVAGEPEALRQLLVNLVLNAVEAAGWQGRPPGRVAVEFERVDRTAVLRVKDSGPGPSSEIAGRLFEPFATDKADGTGLGLYVARQVAEAHGGSIGWRREDGMTCFTVEIPIDGGPG